MDFKTSFYFLTFGCLKLVEGVPKFQTMSEIYQFFCLETPLSILSNNSGQQIRLIVKLPSNL